MGDGITLTASSLTSRLAPMSFYRYKGHSTGTKVMEMELTQWRIFFAVNPSPSNTWPRWPSQCAHRISTRWPSASASRFNGALYLIVKCRPAAVRVKFVFGAIQGSIALFAGVMAADFEVFSQRTGERHFGAFVKQDLLFFCG